MNKVLFIVGSTLVVLEATFDPFEFDYPWLFGPPTFDDKLCSAPGLMCDNCTHVSACIDIGGGSFNKFPVKKCEIGTTCLNGLCVNTTNLLCSTSGSTYKFPCHDSGLFPDPLDCRKYHFCVPEAGDNNSVSLNQYDAQCNQDYGYNAATTFCDKKLVNGRCSSVPVPPCKNFGQIGPTVDNNRIYYVCSAYNDTASDLYPHLFTCKNGTHFQNNKCT